MPKFSKWKERNKYTIYGAAFGALFPIISAVITLFISSNIWVLVGIISTAPLFLGLFARLAGTRQDNISDINTNLENLVKKRTKSIQNLMDVSGQGFLSFGRNMNVNSEYSKECESIFAGSIAGRNLGELLFKNDKHRQDFINGFDLLFSHKARPDVIFDLMENETIAGEKSIKIEYRSISDDEVLCILTDITSEKILQARMRQDEHKRNILFNVIAHKKYFNTFLSEAIRLFELFESANGSADLLKELQVAIHTFKGNAAFFKFDNTKDLAHEMEFLIADSLVLGESLDLSENYTNLKKSYFNELMVVQETLGSNWIEATDSVNIPKQKYEAIEKYLKQKYPGDERLHSTIEHYRKVPFAEMFARYPELVSTLSAKQGKSISQMPINGGQFPVIPEKYEDAVSSFIHIVRNMVDHGIELPEERQIRNKDPMGNITLDLELKGEYIGVTFSDDGQGISIAALKKKALTAGIIKPDQTLTHAEATEKVA